jgi:hypothetical protein
VEGRLGHELRHLPSTQGDQSCVILKSLGVSDSRWVRTGSCCAAGPLGSRTQMLRQLIMRKTPDFPVAD